MSLMLDYNAFFRLFIVRKVSTLYFNPSMRRYLK